MAKKKGRTVPNIRTCRRLFEEQKAKFWKVAKDEEFKHCTDKDAFSGEFYDPEKVLSNYGRVWSLVSEKFIKTCKRQLPDGYYVTDVSASGQIHNINPRTKKPRTKMSIHRAVAYYFCDKKAVEIYGEKNVEAHHKASYTATLPFYDSQKGRYKKYWINNWKNLEWTVKDEHNRITQKQKTMMNQLRTVKEPPFPEMWTETKGLGTLDSLSPNEREELEAILKEKGMSINDIRVVNSELHNHGV